MSKDMLGNAVRKLVELPEENLGLAHDLLTKLSNPGWAEASKRFLRKEEVWPWREKDGVIYFTVTSDGTTGEEWIARLECAGYHLSKEAKEFLCSEDFRPSKGITTEVAVLKGKLFADGEKWTTKTIRATAERSGFKKPDAEIACLIREKFSDEDLEAMGLKWLVIMHEKPSEHIVCEPFEETAGGPPLLHVSLRGVPGEGRWLLAHTVDLFGLWRHHGGFAFSASKAA